MNATLIIGANIVTLALISYSLAFFRLVKKKTIDKYALTFQTLGLILDITATLFMIIGSPNSPFTLHGYIGYSSLTMMIIDTTLIWRHHKNSTGEPLYKRLQIFTRIAFIWWIAAYITGSLIAFLG